MDHYKRCPSLQAVLFVSHRPPQVTVVSRSSGGWDTHENRRGERVQVPQLALELSLDGLYAGIALDVG